MDRRWIEERERWLEIFYFFSFSNAMCAVMLGDSICWTNNPMQFKFQGVLRESETPSRHLESNGPKIKNQCKVKNC